LTGTNLPRDKCFLSVGSKIALHFTRHICYMAVACITNGALGDSRSAVAKADTGYRHIIC
jgi:hypothetical protein